MQLNIFVLLFWCKRKITLIYHCQKHLFLEVQLYFLTCLKLFKEWTWWYVKGKVNWAERVEENCFWKGSEKLIEFLLKGMNIWKVLRIRERLRMNGFVFVNILRMLDMNRLTNMWENNKSINVQIFQKPLTLQSTEHFHEGN